MDISKAIEPRSDQQNFDDYLAGPRTVTVESVDRDAEQRVSIHLVEYPGRPFKPSKTNLRLIAQGWGVESSQWVGRQLILAGDPTVRFGGQQVGGIRVAALSHIDKPFTANLTATRGKRTPYKVAVLTTAPAPPTPRQQMFELLKGQGMTDKDSIIAYVIETLARDVQSSQELTDDDVTTILNRLTQENN